MAKKRPISVKTPFKIIENAFKPLFFVYLNVAKQKELATLLCIFRKNRILGKPTYF